MTASSRPLLSRSGCIYENLSYRNKRRLVLVPFYRGAVVFKLWNLSYLQTMEFSSPFIEERLYLLKNNISTKKKFSVLVPFYRGAVVFTVLSESRVSTSGFSSPFIEERLYFFNSKCLTSNRRCPYSGRIERTAGHISSLPPSHISDGGSSAGAFQ